MARRGLGGSDFSSSFASLYSFNRDQSTAEQAAKDADAQDRYSNGLMTDDEWLGYIAERISATSGKPKDQQRWITAQRKYTVAIADQQAESDFSNGGSINQLIAHYQEKLGGMAKDSNEYRDTQGHLNDLLDKRSGDDLTEKAQAMVTAINKGTKTYGDLRNLLREGLAGARDNSSLKKSIQGQLNDVNETIRSNAVEGSFERLQYEYDSGKLSGGSYAKKLRSMAVQFQANDPKRYYQILEAATQLAKNPGRSGSGGSSGGSGGGGLSTSARKKVNASIDGLQAKRTNIEALMKQYDAGASRGIDPTTGQVVVFSPEKIHQLDLSYIKTEDDLSAAYLAKGDKSAAATPQKYKAAYIATKMVQHNSVAADDQSRELMASTSKLLDNALDNPDPTSAMNQVRYVAKQWSDFSRGLTQKTATTPAYAGDAKRRLPAEGADTYFTGAKGMLDQVDPDLVGRAQTFASALDTISTPGVDDATASTALQQLQAITGGTTASGDPKSNPFVALGMRALEVNSRHQGLATGELVRIATPDGLAWARTETIGMDVPSPTDPSQMVHIEKKVPSQINQGGSWKDLPVDGKSSKLVDVFVDINGTPTKMQAIAQLTTPQGFEAWVATKTDKGKGLVKGAALTDAQLQKYGADKLAAAGFIQQQDVFQSWNVTIPAGTDANGKARASESWSMDPRTGMWYRGSLPVRGVQRNPDGTVKINNDGSLAIDWKAFGTASGAPAPYAGANPKAMQDLLNGGAVNTDDIHSTNLLGEVDPSLNPDFSKSYWSPEDTTKPVRDSWWDDNTQAQKAKDAKQAAKIELNYEARSHGKNPDAATGDFVSSVISSVADLAKGLGINLGGTQPKNPVSPGGFGGPRLPDEGGSLLSGLKTPQKSSLPKIKNPEAVSGPAVTASVADLGLAPRSASVPKVRTPQQIDARDERPPVKAPVTKAPVVKTPVAKAPTLVARNRNIAS